jgi:hypothetical protein
MEFVGQFCGVATMANHPQIELAKFGYRSGKSWGGKFRKLGIPALFWQYVGTYRLYTGISNLFIFPHMATYADLFF